MSDGTPDERRVCAYCGRPIHSDDKCRTNYRGICHASEATCVEELRAALKASESALASTEADRDRYRGFLVALRDADRARNAATDAVDGTLGGPRIDWRRYEEAVDAERRAIGARRAAIAAAIAAVEEG